MIVSELERLSAGSESDWIEGKDGEAGTFSMVSILPKWLGHSSSLRLGKSPIPLLRFPMTQYNAHLTVA